MISGRSTARTARIELAETETYPTLVDAIEQVEGELRIPKLHVQAAERLDPAPEAASKRQIRIEPLRASAHAVLEVVRGQGRLAVARNQLLEAAALRLGGLSLERVV